MQNLKIGLLGNVIKCDILGRVQSTLYTVQKYVHGLL